MTMNKLIHMSTASSGEHLSVCILLTIKFGTVFLVYIFYRFLSLQSVFHHGDYFEIGLYFSLFSEEKTDLI